MCLRCLHHKILEIALNAVVIAVGIVFLKWVDMLKVNDKGGIISWCM